MPTKQIGDLGEKIAEKYLKSKGYRILDKNYCFRIQGTPQKGEIDIVAQKDKIITFVEVKSLYQKIPRPRDFLIEGLSLEGKVNFLKQKKMIKSAIGWLMKNKIPLDSQWQMDVVAIEINPKTKKAKIRHLKNAII